MNTRILAFPALVGCVLALDGCDQLTGPRPEGKGCVDTMAVDVRLPNGQTAHDTVFIRRNPPLCFDPRAAA